MGLDTVERECSTRIFWKPKKKKNKKKRGKGAAGACRQPQSRLARARWAAKGLFLFF